jgi:DNA polymerase-3 subunit beta
MMKVRVLVENLKKGLGVVGGTVATRSSLPILGYVILEADGGAILLKSGNIEAYTTCRVTAKVEEPGDVALPAKLLTELIATYPDGAVLLDRDGSGIRLKYKRRRPLVRGMPTTEFPILPQADGDPLAIFDPAELQEALIQVCISAAVDWSRPVLAGVNFAFENSILELATADGFRLSRKRMGVSDVDAKEGEKLSLIIPAEGLGRLIKLLGEEEEPVHLYRCDQEGALLFRLAGGAGANEGAVFDIDLYMQSIEGTFINYQQIIDNSSAHVSEAVVSTGTLIQTCKSAALFARDAANLIKVALLPNTESGDGGIMILAQSTERGDYEDTIDAQVTRDGGSFLCNVGFFLDVLNVMRSEQVRIGYVNPATGVTITEVGYDDYAHVLMTMRLKEWKG